MKRLTIFLFLLIVLLAATAAAGTKTALFTDTTGTITAVAGDNSFEITDPSAFICVRVEGLSASDNITLVREDYAGTGWQLVTSGNTVVQLNTYRRSVCPAEIGTYALQGNVTGTITAYTEE